MSADEDDRFSVVRYTAENLRAEIADEGLPGPQSRSRRVYRDDYFAEYLEKIGTKTIVVERNYTDRDYLEDFAAYYVRCFDAYGRICRRIHFFAISFQEEDLIEVLRGTDDNDTVSKLLNDNYLGFIVLKPLPQTCIGRTCLRPIYSDKDNDHFLLARPYQANLFGIPLRVKSLAFQQQDRVVSACATSALWSALHWTGIYFQHSIPSPIQITKAASNNLPLETRELPSYGLTAAQMCQALRDIGLDPICLGPKEINDDYVLRTTLYAYLKGKIPVILGIELREVKEENDGTLTVVANKDKHAVTVTGYHLGKPDLTPHTPNGVLLEASRVDKIYVHDDQVGPFTAMSFMEKEFKEKEDEGNTPTARRCTLTGWRRNRHRRKKDRKNPLTTRRYMSTEWKRRNQCKQIVAFAYVAIVPTYHKIRIRFDKIIAIIESFGALLNLLVGSPKLARKEEGISKPLFGKSLVWDVYLTTVNDVKNRIRTRESSLTLEQRLEVLTRAMPRFLWCATLWHDGKKILEILFDATDIEQGNLVVFIVEHNETLSQFLRDVIQRIPKKDVDIFRENERIWQIMGWFS